MTDGVQGRGQRWIGASAVAFSLSAALLPLVGPSHLDLGRLVAHQQPDWSIFFRLRLPRTLLGLFGGAALALGGSIFQSMLRDRLATPDTLGVSIGASLGAVIAISLGWHLVAGVPGIWAGALAGAAGVLVCVLIAATRQHRLSSFGLLLAGMATNSVCMAMIILILGVSGMAQSFAISRWLIGALDAIDYVPLTIFIAVVSTVSIMVVRRARQWNLLAVGEAWASTRGVDVRRLVVFGYVAGSVLAAGTVALTGPIGFIGLVVPHLVRTRISADHRVLMPCAFFFGGVLLASCDAIGRVLLAPAELPAGAITAMHRRTLSHVAASTARLMSRATHLHRRHIVERRQELDGDRDLRVAARARAWRSRRSRRRTCRTIRTRARRAARSAARRSAQAEACGLEPEPAMNPILLKPNGDGTSQVVVNGRVWKTLPARDYYAHVAELRGQVAGGLRRPRAPVRRHRHRRRGQCHAS